MSRSFLRILENNQAQRNMGAPTKNVIKPLNVALYGSVHTNAISDQMMAAATIKSIPFLHFC